MVKWLIIIGIILIGLLIYRWWYFDKTFYKQQEDELLQYTVEVEGIYRELRGIRHDYRNHLQAMAGMLELGETEKLRQYIQELTHEANQADTIVRTGNSLIDSLVNTKLTIAQDAGVTLHTTAIAPSDLSIKNIDLAIILGNLLNNAIEATTRELESNIESEPFIRVYIAPMKNNLYISVTNTMATNPKPGYLSLKRLNRTGYGISRIDQAVERYQGHVNRQWEDGVFATEITIPL